MQRQIGNIHQAKTAHLNNNFLSLSRKSVCTSGNTHGTETVTSWQVKRVLQSADFNRAFETNNALTAYVKLCCLFLPSLS